MTSQSFPAVKLQRQKRIKRIHLRNLSDGAWTLHCGLLHLSKPTKLPVLVDMHIRNRKAKQLLLYLLFGLDLL